MPNPRVQPINGKALGLEEGKAILVRKSLGNNDIERFGDEDGDTQGKAHVLIS